MASSFSGKTILLTSSSGFWLFLNLFIFSWYRLMIASYACSSQENSAISYFDYLQFFNLPPTVASFFNPSNFRFLASLCSFRIPSLVYKSIGPPIVNGSDSVNYSCSKRLIDTFVLSG